MTVSFSPLGTPHRKTPGQRAMRPEVAWIGLGAMGRPMALRLIGAGFRPLVYDIRPKALRSFPETTPHAPSLEAAAQAEFIFSTLPRDAALLQVGAEVMDAMAPDAVYCDMSTVSPEASAEVAALAAGKAYLRAPISGTVPHAEEGSLTVMASGPLPAYERCLPLFGHFARSCFHVGFAEEARYLKLLINNLVGSLAALVAESLALGSKAGLDQTTTLDVLAASAVGSPILRAKLEMLKTRDFSPAFSTEMMIKDMSLFAKAAADLGTPAPLAAVTLDLLRRHAETGGADEDYYSLVKLFERQSKDV